MSEMYNNTERTTFFKKNESLEHSLKDLNDKIANINGNYGYSQPKLPILLLMGCPRAGSTVFLQWLANLNLFSYPSNLIARFFKNPYIGIRTQQSLLEFDKGNQLNFSISKDDFSSNLGKTKGALNPSEYWYFWREYFKFGDINKLTENELKEVDFDCFLQKLVAFEYLTTKPLAMKGMLLNWNISFLQERFDNFIFLDIKRDAFFNAQSLYFARKKFFNDVNKWYSFKPPEYKFIKELNPIEQVAHQVFYTQKVVDDAFENIPSKNKIRVNYEDFCLNPESILNQIIEKYKDFGVHLSKELVSDYCFKPFEVSNKIRLQKEEEQVLRKTLEKLSS